MVPLDLPPPAGLLAKPSLDGASRLFDERDRATRDNP
jgi:hypothetical protein